MTSDNLIQLLLSKGVLSEKDICELNDDSYSSPYRIKAIDTVSKMYHHEDGKLYKGEAFTLGKAKEIYDKWKDTIGKEYTCEDIYIAINAQYHDYSMLYSKWFDDVDEHIIKSAMIFWFMDDDYTGNKVRDYFKL